MNPTRRRIKLDRPLTLSAARGPIQATARSASLTLWGHDVQDCRLDLEIDLATLKRIEDEQLVHLTPDVRLAAAEEPFTDAAPIGLELKLDSTLLAHIPPDPAGAAERIAPAELADGPLSREEGWYALNVRQDRGATQTGYATTWFTPQDRQVNTDGLRLMTEVVAWLDERRWYFEQKPTLREVLRLKHRGDAGEWTCWATTQEEAGLFAFYSEAAFQIPQERLAAVAELCSRINFSLTLGNFELDFDDGSLRFRTSVDVEHAPLTPLLQGLVTANVSLFNAWLPAMRAVAFDRVDPTAVLG